MIRNWLTTEKESMLLSALVSDEEVPLTEDLLMFASRNEVTGAIAARVAGDWEWGQVPSVWRESYDSTAARIQVFLDELDWVAALLADNDIQLVALKNGGIARSIFPFPGAVPMEDIDVLVCRKDFSEAHALLSRSGYSLGFKPPETESSFERSEQAGVAEYSKTLESGVELWFELHWRPVTGRWIRPDQEPTADELMARSIPIDGTAVRLLAPEDNLLQVCLHTARHSYVRAPGFRLHLDVVRIVDAYPDLDWQTFVARVTRLQVKTATFFSLVIPHELFGTAVPAWVLDALRPPRWKERRLRAMIRKAGLFNPHEQKFSRAEYVLFNALLYDDLAGLLRGIFPDRNWMQAQYAFTNPLLLPYYHLKRIGSLLFRRLAT